MGHNQKLFQVQKKNQKLFGTKETERIYLKLFNRPFTFSTVLKYLMRQTCSLYVIIHIILGVPINIPNHTYLCKTFALHEDIIICLVAGKFYERKFLFILLNFKMLNNFKITRWINLKYSKITKKFIDSIIMSQTLSN